MLTTLANMLGQFGSTSGSSTALQAAASGSTAMIQNTFGVDSSLGQMAVNSVGTAG